MTIAVVPSPLEDFLALGASGGVGRFRKHILSKGPLHYHGRVIEIDDGFLDSLVRNFNSHVGGGIVAVNLADAQNRHSDDPARTVGRVTSVERDGGKLYAVLEVPDPGHAARFGKTYLGASALIHMDAADTRTGQRVGPALGHVAVTNRPHLVDLEGYEAIAASAGLDSGDLILLTATEEARVDTLEDTLAEVQEFLSAELAGAGYSDSDVAALTAELFAGAAGDYLELTDYSAAERRELAARGMALEDGSFPVKTVTDLHNAARLWASGHGADRDAAERLIRKRARELGVDVSTLPGFGDGNDHDEDDMTATISRDEMDVAWTELSLASGAPVELLQEAGLELTGHGEDSGNVTFTTTAEEAAAVAHLAGTLGLSGSAGLDAQAAADAEVLRIAAEAPPIVSARGRQVRHRPMLDVAKASEATLRTSAPAPAAPVREVPSLAQAAEIDRLTGLSLSRPSYAGLALTQDERVAGLFAEAQAELALSQGEDPADYGIHPPAASEVERLSQAAHEISGTRRRRMPHGGRATGRPKGTRKITTSTRAHETDPGARDHHQPARGGDVHPEVARILGRAHEMFGQQTVESSGNQSFGPANPATFGQRDRGPWSSYSDET